MTTNVLSSLKVIARPEIASKLPVLAKRMKLIERLEEQSAMAVALRDKQPFTAFKDKTVKDEESGEKTTIKVPRKIRPWYFENSGHYYFEVKLGGKAWEIEPNKPTIDVGDLPNLPEVIKIIISAVEKGELDTYLLSPHEEETKQVQAADLKTKNVKPPSKVQKA
jgi:hypothetical protein